MISRNYRSYEISVWSLQDEFITVLKPSDLEPKGQVQEPIMTLNIDGTEELEFSIPMYIYTDGVKHENPIWYNTRNGVIMASLRKIKVIVNKMTDDEEIFEFVITKVTERHETDELYCDVECEGLAFHELGKIGYKVYLIADDFYKDDLDYFQKGSWTDVHGKTHSGKNNEPKANLQYWVEKFIQPKPEPKEIKSNEWYYTINMNWSGDDERSTDIVYEDTYIASYKGDNLEPNRIEGGKEKERLMDCEESNYYNLTQDLAEKFGIYCKYIYHHDKNYHIIAREVYFYNTFFSEQEKAFDLTYRYQTSSISRESDGTELVTKMFVRPVDSDISASNMITIMDVEANRSREDYLLNFDYLYNIGAISKEAYDAIGPYEIKMNSYNTQLKPLSESMIGLSNQINELEASLQTHIAGAALADERRAAAAALLKGITTRVKAQRKPVEGEETDSDNDGENNNEQSSSSESGSDNESGTNNNEESTADPFILERTELDPDVGVLIIDSEKSTDGNNVYYSRITTKGVYPDTIRVFRTFVTTNQERHLKDEILTAEPIRDEFDNVIRINNLYPPAPDKEGRVSKTIYLTYKYKPALYYENIMNTWANRAREDQALADEEQAKIDELQARLNSITAQYESLLLVKKEDIKAFEKMMGPALREGYWQPDDYTDYGDIHTDSFTVTSGGEQSGSSGISSFLWDSQLFDGEDDLYKKIGVSLTPFYYPCIDLSGYLSTLFAHKNELDKLRFYFRDYAYDYGTQISKEDIRYLNIYALNSQCEFGFIRNKNTEEVIPVLILTGAISLMDQALTYLQNSWNIGTIVTNVGETISNDVTTWISHNASAYIQPNGDWERVYPRIKIRSLALKNDETQLALKYNNESLTNFTDYSILMRTDEDDNYSAGYYITLNADTIFKNMPGSLSGDLEILYTLSNADTAIYLDALQVLKDSSIPQVSYEIDVSVVDEEFIKKVASTLGRIVHVNDYELKFRNVMGYVSEVSLHLDKPWEDEMEIKNYKTKFEDLFTTIVAQTEEMKKRSYLLNTISQAFDGNGNLTPDSMKSALGSSRFAYSFNNGKLTISEKNGIWGVSDAGVVAFRGGGIFTANSKDKEGNWIWNTGILPSGINADLLTSGQLNTELVNIYAGDRLRFQLNGDGLFAYKSFLSDFDILSDVLGENEEETEKYKKAKNAWNTISTKMGNNYIADNVNRDIDAGQYVVVNENGLFLIAREGALVLNQDKTDYIEIGKSFINKYKEPYDGTVSEDEHGNPISTDQDILIEENGHYFIEKEEELTPDLGDNREVQRVAITWDGLTLRRYDNNISFFASADTGDLFLSGSLDANNIYIQEDSEAWRNGKPGIKGLKSWMELKLQMSTALEKLFEEAGNIIGEASQVINNVSELTNYNTEVLNGFAENIVAKYSPKKHEGAKWPLPFKIGDVWIKGNETYVATVNSSDLIFDSEETVIKEDKEYSITTKGWTKTHDGGIAAINGAVIKVDANSGIIDLASQDLYITGNHSVNIGGKYVNIGSTGGINIVNSSITEESTTNNDGKISDATSAVLLNSNGIIIGSSKKIEIESGGSINLQASDDKNTSAVKISKINGIWLGSNQSINLFSGGLTDNSESAGASVSISPTRILFGVSGSTGGTGVKIDESSIILAASAETASNGITLELNNNATGLKLTKDSFGIATTGSNETRNIILMGENGIELGSGTNPQTNGSYIHIAPSELLIGNQSKLQINSGSELNIVSGGGLSIVNNHFILNSPKGQDFNEFLIHNSADPQNVKDEDIVISIAKESDGAGEENYVLKMPNITFDEATINSIMTYFPNQGIYKTSSVDSKNEPIFPSEVEEGSLCVLYAATSGTSTSTFSASNNHSNQDPTVGLTGSSSSTNSRYKKTYFGLYFIRWNVSSNSNEYVDSTITSRYGRVGIAATASNKCALFVKMKTANSIASGNTITLTVKYKSSIGKDRYDQISTSDTKHTRATGIIVNLFTSAPTTKTPVLVGTGKLNVPSTWEISETDGFIPIVLTEQLSKNQDLYAVFYSQSTYSLIYIDATSVKIEQTQTAANNAMGIYIRSAGGWHLLQGSDGAAVYTLPKASTTQLGGIIVGDGLSIDTTGKLSVSSSGTVEIPTANGSTKGGIKVFGNGLKMGGTNNEILQINYGTGLGINNSGQLYVTSSGSGSNVSFSPILTSGTKIGTLTINNNSTTLYAPAGSSNIKSGQTENQSIGQNDFKNITVLYGTNNNYNSGTNVITFISIDTTLQDVYNNINNIKAFIVSQALNGFVIKVESGNLSLPTGSTSLNFKINWLSIGT